MFEQYDVREPFRWLSAILKAFKIYRVLSAKKMAKRHLCIHAS